MANMSPTIRNYSQTAQPGYLNIWPKNGPWSGTYLIRKIIHYISGLSDGYTYSGKVDTGKIAGALFLRNPYNWR